MQAFLQQLQQAPAFLKRLPGVVSAAWRPYELSWLPAPAALKKAATPAAAALLYAVILLVLLTLIVTALRRAKAKLA